MGIYVRVFLFLGSLLTMIYFLSQIRKSRLQISYAVFWSIFSVILLFLSIFPGIPIKIAIRMKIESPVNLIFLVIIFILIIKLFTNTQKLSSMNRQIIDMAQHIAILEKEIDDEKEENKK